MSHASSLTRANYVSNLALTETSGGWSGFNAAIFESLERHFSLAYVGPVSPPEDLRAKVFSKLNRSIGRWGSFAFFSPRRLASIARLVAQGVDHDARLSFFHGATPWIAYHSEVPYACFLDVCFATYVAVYHGCNGFDQRDLDRIGQQERAWLQAAHRVFFSSRWAMESAVVAYDLDRSTLRVVGMGGHLPIPKADLYSGGKEFLFIALDFKGKGGQLCVDAFRQIRQQHANATLRIVGERPPATVLTMDGIAYEGLLRKSVPTDLARLQELLSSAFALVHPTVRDATPQVIIEAQYYGCPAIAPRSFGIPELILDGVSGCLVNAPPTVAEVAEKMMQLFDDPAAYRRLRRSTRAHALAHFTWELVGDRMAAEMRTVSS